MGGKKCICPFHSNYKKSGIFVLSLFINFFCRFVTGDIFTNKRFRIIFNEMASSPLRLVSIFKETKNFLKVDFFYDKIL